MKSDNETTDQELRRLKSFREILRAEVEHQLSLEGRGDVAVMVNVGQLKALLDDAEKTSGRPRSPAPSVAKKPQRHPCDNCEHLDRTCVLDPNENGPCDKYLQHEAELQRETIPAGVWAVQVKPCEPIYFAEKKAASEYKQAAGPAADMWRVSTHGTPKQEQPTPPIEVWVSRPGPNIIGSICPDIECRMDMPSGLKKTHHGLEDRTGMLWHCVSVQDTPTQDSRSNCLEEDRACSWPNYCDHHKAQMEQDNAPDGTGENTTKLCGHNIDADDCPHCCPSCAGTGEIQCVCEEGDGSAVPVTTRCGECDGEGHYECGDCGGSGRID